MAHILSLPNEILSQVFSQNAKDPTFPKVLIVCKRFRLIAEPLLYRTVSLELKPPTTACYTKDTDWDKGNLRKFDNLLSKLSNTPESRDYVWQLSIQIKLHPYYEVFTHQTDLLKLLPKLQSLRVNPPPSNLDLSPFSALSHLHLDSIDTL